VDEAFSEVTRHSQQIRSLELSFNELRTESREETAISIALGGLRIPYNKDRAFGVRVGHYESSNAVAAAGAFRLSKAFLLPERFRAEVNIGSAYGFDYSQARVSAGITWRW